MMNNAMGPAWAGLDYIDDEAFIRGDIPMTKGEIRTLALAKLNILPDSRVLDIGCGTGSVSVACALRCPRGFLTALDQSEEAVSLTRQNFEKFDVKNAVAYLGKAPQDLPKESFDRIFLGGGSKAVEPIIGYAHAHLRPKGIFVANTILLDSTYRLLQALEQAGFEDIDCFQVQINRLSKISGWMMKALNPIFIISATKR